MTAPAPRAAHGYRGLPLAGLLEEVSSPEPMPGAGYCAAITLEMAAALVAMTAGASRAEWGEARGAAAQATTLRERVAPLGERNVDAYREAVALLSGAQQGGSGEESGSGDESLRDALDRAAGVPLEIAEVAVDVASLAAVVAERGEQALRADAVSAALLAEAAARTAATLVEVNLGTTSADERVTRARDLAGSATAAAQRARATLA
jgi:formiminotetrahydrofolate cyclodeaminase